MPWSGGVFTGTNGVFSGTGIWAKDAAAGTKITAAHHDTHDDDVTSGINACLAKDGSNVITILNLSGTVNSTSGIIKVGSLVLASTYGTQNAFFGGAGNLSQTGDGKNTGSGYQALAAVTTGSQLSAFGAFALYSATSANDCSAFGTAALYSLTTGNGNSALGIDACQNVTTGTNNTGLGKSSMLTVTTGSLNVTIGSSADVPSASSDGQLSIQNAIYGTGNIGVTSTISTGNIGFYTKTPTARVHLPAGTATANTAPLKLTSGTLLGTPETGAIEFDGTHLYITIGGVRKTVTVT